MEIICTRPGCHRPRNFFGDLDDEAKIRIVRQKFCTNCGMPLLLADRYIPTKLIGRGGFGAAFLARDRYKPKMPKCAIKQFLPSGDLDPHELAVAQDLFQREAVVLSELGQQHPQIPELYAFFTPMVRNAQDTGEEQYFYLAQEFIDGRDLEAELETKGQFNEAEVTEILVEVLKILAFVHDNNTIHRDIKPSNIMRDRQGVYHLLDFGAVKQVAVGGGNNKKSTGIYSQGFAPPEQMSGLQIYPCTDIYALAVTCITLLTGKPAQELYDSFNHNWQWRNYAIDTSDRLAAVLDRMLLSIPAQRFQSAREALAALENNNSPASTSILPTPTKPASNSIKKSPKPTSPQPKPKYQPNFSLLEVIGSAAFTGFEGTLLYVGLTSLLSVSGISLGILGMVMGGTIFALYRRAIEKIDLIILAGISAAAIAFIPPLHSILPLSTVFVVAVVSAAVAIAVTTFFRLVYRLLSHFL